MRSRISHRDPTVERRANRKIEYAVSLLKNVHIINESIVSSVNDMVTEIAVQFVAKNFEDFEEFTLKKDVLEDE